MIAYSGELYRHLAMIHTIGQEVLTIRNPVVLSETAAERKPTMMLLPYGIPIADRHDLLFRLGRPVDLIGRISCLAARSVATESEMTR